MCEMKVRNFNFKKEIVETKNEVDYDEETSEKHLTHIRYYNDGTFELDVL